MTLAHLLGATAALALVYGHGASAAPRTLTNGDIIAELSAGLSETIILLSIDANECHFDLAPAQLIDLRRRGVRGSILHAMLATVGRHGATTTAVAAPQDWPSAARRQRRFPEFPVDFFAVRVTSREAGTFALGGALFVGGGRLRFESADGGIILVDPATLAGYEVTATGEAREAGGFQGVRGAINQIGLSPYWLPADPQRPCAGWLSVECQPLGTEEVDGRPANKWAVTRYFDDQSALSYIWVDIRLHIVSRVRVDERTTELRNIIEISQPRGLFEAPES